MKVFQQLLFKDCLLSLLHNKIVARFHFARKDFYMHIPLEYYYIDFLPDLNTDKFAHKVEFLYEGGSGFQLNHIVYLLCSTASPRQGNTSTWHSTKPHELGKDVTLDHKKMHI